MEVLSQETLNMIDFYKSTHTVKYIPFTGSLEQGNLILAENYSKKIKTTRPFSYSKDPLYVAEVTNDMVYYGLRCYNVVQINKETQEALIIDVEIQYKLMNDMWYLYYEDYDSDESDCHQITPVTQDMLNNVQSIKRTYISNSFISEYQGKAITGMIPAYKYLTDVSYDNVPVWCQKY